MYIYILLQSYELYITYSYNIQITNLILNINKRQY